MEATISHPEWFKLYSTLYQAASFQHPSNPGPHQTRLFAIDCEMVECKQGGEGLAFRFLGLGTPTSRQLARITLVEARSTCNTKGNLAEDIETVTIFDEYVKPGLPVTVYRMDFSGVTPSDLEGANILMCL